MSLARAPLVLADELGALELVADLQIEIPLHGIGLANRKYLCDTNLYYFRNE